MNVLLGGIGENMILGNKNNYKYQHKCIDKYKHNDIIEI